MTTKELQEEITELFENVRAVKGPRFSLMAEWLTMAKQLVEIYGESVVATLKDNPSILTAIRAAEMIDASTTLLSRMTTITAGALLDREKKGELKEAIGIADQVCEKLRAQMAGDIRPNNPPEAQDAPTS